MYRIIVPLCSALVLICYSYFGKKSIDGSRELASNSNSNSNSNSIEDFYHLSEGSDIYPYDWLVRIKSAYEREKNLNWESSFFTDIDSRVNVIKNPNPQKYLIDYIGLSTSWSGYKEDALKSDKETSNDYRGMRPVLRTYKGDPSTRMVGVNCAFCHTSKVSFNDKEKIIDGGQGHVNLQRLYGDMVISTLALLINFENQLEEFLVSFDYTTSEAKTLAENFAKRTLSDTRLGTKLTLFLQSKSIVKKIKPWFLEKEVKNVATQFKRLFRLTHRIKDDDALGNELNRRFDYLAHFVAGHPKKTTQGGQKKRSRFKHGNDGYGRLEAFISAGNRVFRKREDWVSTNAAVGFPSIWGIEYKALFHYTGNTNSVLVRNIGQAMGLGAIFLDDKYDTTVNVENLVKLEDASYNIQSPKWTKVFNKEFVGDKIEEYKIDSKRASRGKKLYQKHCAVCHTPKKVGPNKSLDYYNFYSLEQVGTDPNLAINIAKSITSSLEYSSIFATTGTGIIKKYAQENNVPSTKLANWLSNKERGKEWIRETYSTDRVQHQGKEDNYPKVPKGSAYLTRNLAGIWSTAPYLHNNSVPTLWHLLQPVNKRPQLFERGKNFEIDPKLVGIKQRFPYTQDFKGLAIYEKQKNRPQPMARKRIYNCRGKKGSWEDDVWEVDVCFDTKLSGNSNQGHEFGVNLKEYEKFDLIEYLKTL